MQIVMKDIGDVRSIRDHATYEAVLDEIELYRACVPRSGTHKAERIDLLLDLIEAYEMREMRKVTLPVRELVSHFMRNHGLRQADLARILGSRSRASEFLSGKRRLSMAQARKIQQAWLIPPEALIR